MDARVVKRDPVLRRYERRAYRDNPLQCPCCGQVVAPELFMTETIQKIYNVMSKHPFGLSYDALWEMVYGNKGPETRSTLRRNIVRLNRYLARVGLVVRGAGGPHSIYRLVTVGQDRLKKNAA